MPNVYGGIGSIPNPTIFEKVISEYGDFRKIHNTFEEIIDTFVIYDANTSTLVQNVLLSNEPDIGNVSLTIVSVDKDQTAKIPREYVARTGIELKDISERHGEPFINTLYKMAVANYEQFLNFGERILEESPNSKVISRRRKKGRRLNKRWNYKY